VRLNQVADDQDGFADIDSLSIRSGKPNVGIRSPARATPRP
jgi:hypothetical protein